MFSERSSDPEGPCRDHISDSGSKLHFRNRPQNPRQSTGRASVAGAVHATGAQLRKISSPALENRLTEFVCHSKGSAANFALITRGGHKNLVLELRDVIENAAIEVRLQPIVERTSTPVAYHKAARSERDFQAVR